MLAKRGSKNASSGKRMAVVSVRRVSVSAIAVLENIVAGGFVADLSGGRLPG